MFIESSLSQKLGVVFTVDVFEITLIIPNLSSIEIMLMTYLHCFL